MSRFALIAGMIVLAGPALAGAHTQGIEESDGVAGTATEQGTLHPGHVAVFASGKYNKPAEEFHFPEPAGNYAGGPGGWAETRGKKD